MEKAIPECIAISLSKMVEKSIILYWKIWDGMGWDGIGGDQQFYTNIVFIITFLTIVYLAEQHQNHLESFVSGKL